MTKTSTTFGFINKTIPHDPFQIVNEYTYYYFCRTGEQHHQQTRKVDHDDHRMTAEYIAITYNTVSLQ